MQSNIYKKFCDNTFECLTIISITKENIFDGIILLIIILSSDNNTKNFTNQSILIMFTWRDIKKRKKISQQYINNSIKLLNDLNLKQIMEKYNIILYFTFHRFILNKYKKKYKTIISSNKYIIKKFFQLLIKII